MAKTRMPRDDNNQSIQLLRFRGGGAQTFSINPSYPVLSSQLPEGTRVITLVCEVAAYFETGGETVSATIAGSHFIPAYIPYDIALGTDLSDTDGYHRYVSIITMGDAGLAHISERE